MNDQKKRRSPLARNLVILFFVLAIFGFVIAALMFSSWSRYESATAVQATASFDEALAQIEDQRAYITISPSGEVEVNRELENQTPAKLAALNLLAWEPGVSRLVRVRFPFWFVKIKTTGYLNLGTFVSLLSKDWEHWDLKVTQDNLMQRGPGLVLDHTRPDGGRIVLWSE